MSETQAEPGLDPDCGQGIHHLIQPAEIELARRLFTFHPAGLAAGAFEVEAEPIPIEKEDREAIRLARQDGGGVVRKKDSDRGAATIVTSKTKKAAGIYTRLVAAGNRLMTVIRHNEGGANKDLKRMTEEINRLCDKWDR